MRIILLLALTIILNFSVSGQNKTEIQSLNYLISPSIPSPQNETYAKVIEEEIGIRTGLSITPLHVWSGKKPILAIALQGDKMLAGKNIPKVNNGQKISTEGYSLTLEQTKESSVIWVIGADVRGVLFGIGKLLRIAGMRKGSIELPSNLELVSSPEYSLRGHQLGYRNTANSWDAWTVDQFERYIRELALFGSNSFEGIPFQETDKSGHMLLPRLDMNIKVSELCEKYDLDYWIWIPSEADLSNAEVREKELKLNEDFYKVIPRLDGVFFPGGDPGDNHPKEVLSYLEELSTILHQYHPKAGVWISLQGFNDEMVDYFFNYLYKYEPDWLTGVAYGPSSPEVDVERRRLPTKYKHRLYGDLTHTVRCQYPTEKWDQAYALTEGREVSNPQPYYYAKVFREDVLYTDGFLSYSDGVHDDVNKVIWNQMGWDSNADVRGVMIEYSRFFFGSEVAESAADGILALEQNWEGPLVANGSVETTLEYWHNLALAHPEMKDNWRWQLLQIRAYYDGYTRHRLIYEKALEKQAYSALGEADIVGIQQAMNEAIEILNKATSQPIKPDLKLEIEKLAEALYHSIGLQSSVPKYQASGYERGAFMDFIDYPLNNRWWLEDEFKKISSMKTDKEKDDRLNVLINWENPGPGGFYDNISDVSASPNVVSVTEDAIDYAWWDNGKSRKRLSTQLFQFSPVLEYRKLDANSNYTIRVSGYGEALLKANGTRLTSTKYDKELETFKEFVLPKALIKDGTLKITFDTPDEKDLNWRQYSKVTEVWLIKQ